MDLSSAVGSAGASAQGQQAPGSNKFSELSSDEFVKVLFTELQNQDPMEPQDTGALLEQLSSLRNIESQMSLQDELQSLVTQNQIAGAGNLIGKQVAGLTEGNEQITGLVSSVRVKDDQVVLELDTGQRLAMSQVTGISEPGGAGSGGGNG